MNMPPPRTTASTPREPDFERQSMVRWFDPTQLAQTAIRVVLSSIFGAYADKRELQAAFEDQPRVHRHDPGDEPLWIDYVADLGDGWGPTYTIAYLLGRPSLRVDGQDLPRGRFLLMGGDQVYPTADRVEYENRTLGPYRSALPESPSDSPPLLYAIPGNHDWYDGLTNFLRIFCQDGWIGGWKTEQNRSYFAIELPHGWWLWAIDIQFDVYVDKPQLDYFRAIAAKWKPGSRVILVTGKPSWIRGTQEPNPSYDNLRYFEERVIEPAGGELVVTITGDDHHYARYEENADGANANGAPRRQKLTAGGGGAFTSATHHLKDPLPLRRRWEDRSVEYGLRKAYPDRKTSKRLPWWSLWRLPVQNLHFMRAIVLAYLIPAILLQAPARRKLRQNDEASWWELWWAVVWSKFVVYAALIVVSFLILFAAVKAGWRRFALGFAHAVPHVLLLTVLVASWTWFLTAYLNTNWATRYDLLVAVLAAAVATPLGTVLIALYLIVCDRFLRRWGVDRHTTEVFACQAIREYKNFVRMRLDREGLTIYPIAVEKALEEDDFELDREGSGDAPLFRPKKPIEVGLVEPPIAIRVPPDAAAT